MTDAVTERASQRPYAVLVADPDARVRALLLSQLAPMGCVLHEAADGETVLRLLREHDIRIVLTELYLKTGETRCVIEAIRDDKSLRKTRALAHTQFSTSNDRDWAIKIGADAYLIRPVNPDRLRDAVARVANQTPRRSSRTAPIARRDSLDAALKEKERGADSDVSTIVFGQAWWAKLSRNEQSGYRKRAKQAGVSLRSDTLIGSHFVEVRRSRADEGLSSERAESSHRH
jgi:two-component system chemotaxis response regulator CheY